VKRLCFYHAGCPDGLGAALAVKLAWGSQVRLTAHGHDDAVSVDDAEDATVVYVDIAPNNEVLRAIGPVADKIIVLDHHISSKRRFESDPELADYMEELGHEIHFDLTRSGAVMAWEYFHPGEPLPDLYRYVQDQDLWNWELHQSREVNAAIGSYPQQLEVWEGFVENGIPGLAEEGTAIVRANRAEVAHTLKSSHVAFIDGERIEAVNCSTHSRSSVGHELAARARFDKPWGLVYRISSQRVHLSIYSIGELDISKVAVHFGGGGHPNASGFNVSLEQWLKDFL
jgi:oligoribonuclease NrnB/cAMP/cGMP phosphodiesterase (DHH superfamily)